MQFSRRVVLIVSVAALMSGCGGGGGGSSSVSGPSSPSTPPPPVSTLGSATISWSAPMQNTDNSQLTNLAGYQIRYGQNAGALDSYRDVDTVGTTVYVIESLTPGTWYFTVAARNSQGVLSNPSAPVSKVIS